MKQLKPILSWISKQFSTGTSIDNCIESSFQGNQRILLGKQPIGVKNSEGITKIANHWIVSLNLILETIGESQVRYCFGILTDSHFQ
jgi:hypothetical protein